MCPSLQANWPNVVVLPIKKQHPILIYYNFNETSFTYFGFNVLRIFWAVQVCWKWRWAIISKSVRNWRPQMPKTNFNKVSTLWTCQTYMENMSTVLKPDEISFGVLFFRQNCVSSGCFWNYCPNLRNSLINKKYG